MRNYEILYRNGNDLVINTINICCKSVVDAEQMFHRFCRGIIVSIKRV